MLDLIIYAALVLGLTWVGWTDRNQPFDYAHSTPLAQEEGTNGAHD